MCRFSLLYASAIHFGGAYPSWLVWWLWISYILLFTGELQAWWVPYLFRSEPIRAARYQSMLGFTHKGSDAGDEAPRTLPGLGISAVLQALAILSRWARVVVHETPRIY
jgi:hypothetical protein